jgi:molybdenum cofactor guanylyltransferase
MNNLLGVVLCGGESRRMGRDKGLLLQGNKPWAIYMADKLAPFRMPVVFSINQRQLEAYSALILAGQLVIDSLDLPGPLKGLLSVHRKFPEKDLLLLACDMMDLDDGTIRKMIGTYSEEMEGRPRTRSWENRPADGPGESSERESPGESPDFFVYQEDHFAQPFCGIYTANGLLQASATLSGQDHHDQHDFSFQGLLGKGKTRRLMIDRPEAFKNYNTV